MDGTKIGDLMPGRVLPGDQLTAVGIVVAAAAAGMVIIAAAAVVVDIAARGAAVADTAPRDGPHPLCRCLLQVKLTF
jgi:hypothetical protein